MFRFVSLAEAFISPLGSPLLSDVPLSEVPHTLPREHTICEEGD